MSSKSGKTLIGLLGDIADGTAKNASAIDRLVACIGGNGAVVPDEAKVDRREEILVRYTMGRGKVRSDGRGLSLDMQLFTLNGERDGRQIASGEVTAESIEDLLKPPPRVEVKFGEPGPIEEIPITTLLKATWTFSDGDSITAIGKGVSQLMLLQGGAQVLADVAAMAISDGTGQYEGARGTVTTIGHVFIPAGESPPFGQPGAEVFQKATQVFRIFRGTDVVS